MKSIFNIFPIVKNIDNLENTTGNSQMMKNKDITPTMRICFAMNMIVTFFLLQGCVQGVLPNWGTKSGYYYVAQQDEILSDIAKTHQIDVRELSTLNNLDDDRTTVKKGTVLFIPGFNPPADSSGSGKRVLWFDEERNTPSKTAAPHVDQEKKPEVQILEGSLVDKTVSLSGTLPKETSKATENNAQPVAVKTTGQEKTDKEQTVAKIEQKKPSEPVTRVSPGKVSERKFIWPARGKVISSYGPQKNGMFYNGIRIDVSKETTVIAAASGHVIFSAALKDYGETVIIRHDDRYATVYTNLGKSLVKPDQKVKQGDPIALVSPSQGSSSFDFEIRHRNKAQDPIPLLSP